MAVEVFRSDFVGIILTAESPLTDIKGVIIVNIIAGFQGHVCEAFSADYHCLTAQIGLAGNELDVGLVHCRFGIAAAAAGSADQTTFGNGGVVLTVNDHGVGAANDHFVVGILNYSLSNRSFPVNTGVLIFLHIRNVAIAVIPAVIKTLTNSGSADFHVAGKFAGRSFGRPAKRLIIGYGGYCMLFAVDGISYFITFPVDQIFVLPVGDRHLIGVAVFINVDHGLVTFFSSIERQHIVADAAFRINSFFPGNITGKRCSCIGRHKVDLVLDFNR